MLTPSLIETLALVAVVVNDMVRKLFRNPAEFVKRLIPVCIP